VEIILPATGETEGLFPAGENVLASEPKTITMRMPIASEVKQEDDRDCLSDSHRDYMQRYVEYELEKQKQASKTFLRERFKASTGQAG
jgi:hypothetical protein